MGYVIKDLPMDERPREKLAKYGVDNLTDVELLAIIIKTGTKSKNVKEIAYELINKYENFYNISKLTVEELCQIKGIGRVKAIELISSFEIGKRINKKEIVRINCADDIYNLYYEKIAFKEQEELHVIFLDHRKKILGMKMIFKGTVNASGVYPRDILREALKINAVCLILVHNHPSDITEPSGADIDFTIAISALCIDLGLRLIDHIIIGSTNYYSFLENGYEFN